jgi:arylsulfatase
VLGVKWPEPRDYKWELYNLADDPTQYNDVAPKYPDKHKEMQQIFTEQAWENNVFPLDNKAFSRALSPRPNAAAGVSVFTYSGEVSGIAPGGAPPILGRSFTITADIDVPQGGVEGMLVTEGGVKPVVTGSTWSKANRYSLTTSCS